MSALRYYATADSPVLQMWVYDDNDDLIDFSSGYTFVFKIGNPGETALLTKSSGITGDVGAGEEPTGTPNIVITFTAGQLALAPGTYSWNLTATSASLDRVFGGAITILDTID